MNYVPAPAEIELSRYAYIRVRRMTLRFDGLLLGEAVPDLKLPTEVAIRVSSRGLESRQDLIKTAWKEFGKPIVLGDVEPLRCPVNDLRYARAQKVLVVVYSSGTCIAQAVCLMNSVSPTHYEMVKTVLERGTHLVGEMSCEVRLSP